MRVFGIFRTAASREAAQKLYTAVVEQARRPAFYLHCGVPDTVDGRFDMIALHAFLVMRRLRPDAKRCRRLAQDLFDVMFADMDQNLREMGVGDLGVGPRVKAMVRAFYGRAVAYDSSLAADGGALGRTLRRNLFRGTAPDAAEVEAMAGYVRREAGALEGVAVESLLAGEVAFGPAPVAGEAAAS